MKYRRNPRIRRRRTKSKTNIYVIIVLAMMPFAVLLQGIWISGHSEKFDIARTVMARIQSERIECPECSGAGIVQDAEDIHSIELCPICYGLGCHHVRRFYDDDVICPVCGGMGRVMDDETGVVGICPRCDGRGLIRLDEETETDDTQ